LRNMDALTHEIHSIFDEHLTLTPGDFNGMAPKEQFEVFNLIRFEVRFRVLPQNSGVSDTGKLLKEIDEKLSAVLFD